MQKGKDMYCSGTACWTVAKSWVDSEWNRAPQISSNFRERVKIFAASQPTPCSRLLITKLTVPQPVQTFTAIHVTRNFITYDLYCSPNTFWMIKSRRMRWGIGEVQQGFGREIW